MKINNKILAMCVSTAAIISVGNWLGTYLFRELIDAPSFDLVVKLSLIWLFTEMILITKKYIVQKYYLKGQKNHMGELLKMIFSFPFYILETKQYHDDLNKLKDKTVQEQAYISSVEKIVTALSGIVGLYILLISQISTFAIFLLSVFLCFIIIVLCIVNGRLSILLYDYWEKYVKNTRKYNYISKVLSHKDFIEEKKVFSYLPFFKKEFETEFDHAAEKNQILGKKRIKLELLTDIIFLLYLLFACFLLFFCYYKNRITIGTFISAAGYMLTVLTGISGAIESVEHIMKYKKFKEDYVCFTVKKEIMSEAALAGKSEPDETIAMGMKNVFFKYSNSEKNVLNNISFSFQKGKKYAIVGVNGSGKTTFAKIASGLYQPVSGIVDVRTKPIVLFQDFNKYPVSLKENIMLSEKYGLEDELKIADIEQKAGLRKRIEKMKFKDDTELTTLKECGEELSGGEWQRLALARILWQDADLYILDEPTASLDPLEEIRIFRAYNDLLKEKTVIYITHRLGFVKDVDEILVFNNGKIAEAGNHSELIALQKGIYKNMFEEQRIWYG